MRVLVIDDHPVIHEVMRHLVPNVVPGATVVCEHSLETALCRLRTSEPVELVVLDLCLPDCVGLEALTRMRASDDEVPIVVFSATEDAETILAVMQFGAHAFIPKSTEFSDLKEQLRAAATSRPSPSANASNNRRKPANGCFQPPRPRLTERQWQVLDQLRTGSSNYAIARALGISENTVKQHLHAIFQAMGVSSRAAAIVQAARHGFEVDDNRLCA